MHLFKKVKHNTSGDIHEKDLVIGSSNIVR